MARAIAVLAIGSALIGCGAADPEPAEPARDRPWEEVCRDVIDEQASIEKRGVGACAEPRSWRCDKGKDRLRRGELRGRSIDEAEEVARRHGCVFRIVERDGKELVVTMDYRRDRINVAVEDGRVVRVEGIG